MTPRMGDDYVAFVRARQGTLLRSAYLICGDHHLAEDLLQDALVKLASRWERVRDEKPEAYVRKILYRDAISRWRRSRREHLVDDQGQPRGMPPPGLVRALGVVAEEVGDADVAEAAWRWGRGARRRRHAVVAGLAATVVGVGALAATSVLTQADREITVADAADGTGATVSAAPAPSPFSPQARAAQLRDELRVACLRDASWSVSVDGRDGSWSARGKRLADGTTADLGADLSACDDLIGLGPRVERSTRGTRPDPGTDALARQVYREYRSVAGCLRQTHLTVPTVPDEDSFVYEYALAGGPTWHPYLSVRRLTDLGEIMRTCPVNPIWAAAS